MTHPAGWLRIQCWMKRIALEGDNCHTDWLSVVSAANPANTDCPSTMPRTTSLWRPTRAHHRATRGLQQVHLTKSRGEGTGRLRVMSPLRSHSDNIGDLVGVCQLSECMTASAMNSHPRAHLYRICLSCSLYLYSCIYVCIWRERSIYVYMNMFINIYTYTFLYIYYCIHVNMFIYVYTHICTHIFIYIYIYIDIYIYIYICVHSYSYRMLPYFALTLGLCVSSQVWSLVILALPVGVIGGTFTVCWHDFAKNKIKEA